MAQRKSSTMVEARERARRAAAESMEREERLLELGEKFFIAQGTAEDISDAAEKKMAEIRAKVEEDLQAVRADQASVVSSMKSDKVSVAEIGQRLELTPAEVRTLLKLSGTATGNTQESAADSDGNDKPVTLQQGTEGETTLAEAS